MNSTEKLYKRWEGISGAQVLDALDANYVLTLQEISNLTDEGS